MQNTCCYNNIDVINELSVTAKRVYCLYRVSTKGQVIKDDIPMQRIECEKFAKAQGWTIIKEFSEKGVSGFKVSEKERDAVQDIKAAALRKEFDILLVFMFDRVGRRDDETPFVVEWFVKQGIQVWSTKEGEQRFDTHVDKLMNYIRFWQASGESIKTSVRIKTRMEQLTQEGVYRGGTVPYGYKLEKRGRVNKKGIDLYDLAVEPTEAEYVKLMFDKTVKDGMGSYQIARFLNEKGLRTHSGSKFQSNTVNRILKNKIYCGYLSSGNVTSGFIEELKIIDENIYDTARNIVTQRLAKNNDKRTIALNNKGKTLLSGNIFCAHCGGRLVVTRYQDRYIRKDGSEYKIDELKYTCYHKTKKLNDCDGQTSYRAEKIDNAVLAVLEDLFKKIKEIPQSKALERRYKLQVSGCNERYKKANAEVEKLNNQLKTLKLEIGKALVGESTFTAEQLSEAIKVTQNKLSEAILEMENVKSQLDNKKEAMGKLSYHYESFLSWANEFENSPLEQRKMIACQLIRQVLVSAGYNIKIEFDMNYQQFCEGL